MVATGTKRIELDGKFFRIGGKRLFLRAVTYGPFPDPQPEHAVELERIVDAGFNAIRVYDSPSEELLDAAHAAGLMVMVGLSWQWYRVFSGGADNAVFQLALEHAQEELRKWGSHPAVVACFVANEIRPDVARWVGVEKVRSLLEQLIDEVQRLAPHLLVAYASYPSSEFLEPSNADFTAMNVYLESAEAYQKYLRRLHHLAGDRPVVIAEFGVDSLGLGEEAQAEMLAWSLRLAQAEGMAGWTCFSWSDSWFNGGRLVEDWRFGLVQSDGAPKPALEVVGGQWQPNFEMPMISVIICVYNGADRIGVAVESLRQLNYPNYELIVVDDGSTDGTREVLDAFDFIHVVDGEHAGLSVARNAGASVAMGEIFSYTDDDCAVDADYLFWLAKGYAENGWDACGGPNIPPAPEGEDEAVVASALGAPSHVMLDDVEAEHIPGCHLSVRRGAFEAIGGFRRQYRVAGDDVDFCWRLRDAGYRIGFHGASFVWHRRRTHLWRYFRQQWGYGKAEALLMRDHPEKFKRGSGASWKGCVYTGAAAGATDGSVIYHGAAGEAGYQVFWNLMMPSRPLAKGFDDCRGFLKLSFANGLQPWLRRIARWFYSREWIDAVPVADPASKKLAEKLEGDERELVFPVESSEYRHRLIDTMVEQGWEFTGEYDHWDMQRGRVKALLVSEMLAVGCWRVRVRLIGPMPSFQKVERELIAGLAL